MNETDSTQIPAEKPNIAFVYLDSEEGAPNSCTSCGSFGSVSAAANASYSQS